ncbi:YbhB/YbcL family Raf kinase inhibitor-like protein [Rhodoferax antarcticus]|uniref:YbhB/YbcL family Raf kinase inhibitor-like protein n=1 Tax=Rhodoferax antarcticus TaxID=81479 RepID=UPI002224DCF9|nr:YbhB/YbcL family Raf kinase inhibitor-like protein [Rhodoferax antarcticus]MCW2311030.1 Raf kinase inhibitor-like YbhB/YbcL family protein [Rhodoferax antarcticus]
MPPNRLFSTVFCATALSLSLAGGAAHAQKGPFMLSSPDLAMGTFADKFVLNGFGCKGGNVSPALVWQNVPPGTKSLALQVFDPDAPTGAGFWHWTVYGIAPTATSLAQGAGNTAAKLPAPAYGGANDYLDTGATGGNGNYGGPCPPEADKPHRYIFTLYALAVDDLAKAGGIPKTGTPSLYSFVLNKGLGDNLIDKTSFTATYGR